MEHCFLAFFQNREDNFGIIYLLLILSILFLALILVGTAIKTRKKIFSFFSLGWIIFYLTLGFVQYERALSGANELAKSRGHDAERLIKTIFRKYNFMEIHLSISRCVLC